MTMPAGRYYIGDLCYVMHDEWDEACTLFFPTNQSGRGIEGEFTLKDGRRFASFTTAYGDGEYYNNQGVVIAWIQEQLVAYMWRTFAMTPTATLNLWVLLWSLLNPLRLKR